MFYKTENRGFSGIYGTYVDDTFHAGDESYMPVKKKLKERNYKERVWDIIRFTRIQIESENSCCVIRQTGYIEKL